MRPLLIACMMAMILPASAAALDVGSRLPALREVSWLGAPVDTTGRFTVIDLWSPDDPACRATMPRMTDLQHRHPEVRVIGLTAADRERTADFVSGMAQRVDYAIGVVPALADYAPPVGSPSALLVDRSGTVLWWGDALDVVEPLTQALAGTFVPEPLPPRRIEVLPSLAPAAAPAEGAPAQQPAEIQPPVCQPHSSTHVVVVVGGPWWWSGGFCAPHAPLCLPLPLPPLPFCAPLPPPFFVPHFHHHH